MDQLPAARTVTAEVANATPRHQRLSRKHQEWLAAALFLLPDALGLLVFLGVPMVLALSLGFFDVNGFGEYRFIGFKNYQEMFKDPLFLKSLRVTVTYVVILVPATYAAGLGLALLMKQRLPFIGILRAMFFLPYVISLVVIGLLWQYMLVDRVGFVNKILSRLGFAGQSWLGDPNLALGSLLVVTVWFLMGYYMIIFLAGLQEIPREYYEAARIDGAPPWRTFLDITLPLLKPTSFFVLLISTVSAVAGGQGFDLVYIMTKGGPANSTSLVIYYIYQQAFQYSRYGYAAAMASFLVVVLLLLTLILFLVTKGGRFDFD
ncbi:MAG TPA: sugar ABC transporter permease [Thermomicrobiales bacterium]|nr:sugar ABC transporter permease [Thermomicrobiales bacterium]